MKSIHNFSLLDTISPNNFWQNRAFLYGDGLFETLIFWQGKTRYLADHYQRLTAGMAVLDLTLPNSFSAVYLEEAIAALVQANGLGDKARIKMQVWRRPGGLYTPESQEAEFLITTLALPPHGPTIRENVIFYEDMRLHASPLSLFKTCSALPYVLAGLARKRAGADEVILLDVNANVAECVASNLFWLTGNTLYTPSLETGCIAGILRKQILLHAAEYGFHVLEGTYPKEALLRADIVFCCNVAGTQFMAQIAGNHFATDPPSPLSRLLEKLYA